LADIILKKVVNQGYYFDIDIDNPTNLNFKTFVDNLPNGLLPKKW
jgi:hypothetical protein